VSQTSSTTVQSTEEGSHRVRGEDGPAVVAPRNFRPLPKKKGPALAMNTTPFPIEESGPPEVGKKGKGKVTTVKGPSVSEGLSWFRLTNLQTFLLFREGNALVGNPLTVSPLLQSRSA